jgi:YegS/Rv2252/BmrU family lipid kinase
VRLLVLGNAQAGGADGDGAEAALAVLRESADVELVRPEGDRALDDALDRRDDRPLVVVGGDGSLHTALQALHRRRELPARPVGLIPLGTGNDFARTVGIPLEPAEAATVVLTGAPRELDLITDDLGGVVVNAAHLGVGAMATAAASGMKPMLGAAAYALGGVLAGVRATGWRLRVEVDGRAVAAGDARLLMAGVANGRTIGGGTPFAPEADPADGLLDVVVSAAVGPLARLGYALRMRKGAHLQRGDVSAVRGRVVTVRGERVPINVDGEVGETVASRTWTVQPSAWRLVGPA